MHEIEMPRGSMWLDVLEGVVVSQQKWSETHVSSSGGGGYLHNGTGVIHAPTVSSSSSEQLEFWVQFEDGSEKSFQFSNSGFAVRDGHRVRFAWGARSDQETGELVLVKNLTSGVTRGFVEGWYEWAEGQRLVSLPFLYRTLRMWLGLFLAVAICLFSAGRIDRYENGVVVHHDLSKKVEAPSPIAAYADDVVKCVLRGAEITIRDIRSVVRSVSGREDLPSRMVSSLEMRLLTFLGVWLLVSLVLKLVGFVLYSHWYMSSTGLSVRRRVLEKFESVNT